MHSQCLKFVRGLSQSHAGIGARCRLCFAWWCERLCNIILFATAAFVIVVFQILQDIMPGVHGIIVLCHVSISSCVCIVDLA